MNNNILQSWATRHNVTPAALAELHQLLTATVTPDSAHASTAKHAGSLESDVQSRVRLAAARHGILLWRNNVGAGKLGNGSFVRWGLCNDTSLLNDKVKSADLIGIRPVVITQAHVGSTIGQFVSLECKREGWKYSGTKREAAQKHWLEVIQAAGGDARFITSEGGL